MGHGDSFSNNQHKWKRNVTIILLKDGVEQERKSFEATLDGNSKQFEYLRAWEANGSNYTWERL